MGKTESRLTKPNPERKCDRCGNTYFRRNRMEAWTSRSVGHRRGWQKETIKVCIKCMDVKEARRIISIVQIGVGRMRVAA